MAWQYIYGNMEDSTEEEPSSMERFGRKLLRKKIVDSGHLTETQLARCLNTLDLTALGIGSTLGAGIYVVAGQVAHDKAGPGVIISFLIAALASVLAGLCYAEFGARVPKTGSAYVYSYVTVGEFMAFIIGWNLILEYVIGTASVARAWSSYFDSLIHYAIQNFFKEKFPMHVGGLSPYPDFFALGITLFLTIILAVGVKESSRFNNIFTGVNLLVVFYIVVCGAFKADGHNWRINPNEVHDVNATVGEGGFLPFGISGVMSGAATCFYAFVGFDAIATTGEEVKNPQKAIPISIVLSLLFCFLAYFGISTIVTLMCPFYLLDTNAPLPAVFERVGWDVAKYIIAVGAICGLSTSLLGAMFPLPRVLYAIASDGLIFRFLSRINDRFKTPFIATIISGIFAGLMAMLFDLQELVDMMSIGTLLAYTLVAVSVLLLRYKEKNIGGVADDTDYIEVSQRNPDESADTSQLIPGQYTKLDILKLAFTWRTSIAPSPITEVITTWDTALFCIGSTIASVFLRFASDDVGNGDAWAVLLTIIFALFLLICVFSIWCQPQNPAKLSFTVPFVPFLPAISIFVNVFLMLKLSDATWIRFGVWMFIGFIIYFSYGIWHSSAATYHSDPDHVSLTQRTSHLPEQIEIISDESEESDEDEFNKKLKNR